MTSEINILKKYLKEGQTPTGGFVQEKVAETSLIYAMMNSGTFTKLHSDMVIEFGEERLVFKDDEADKAGEMLAEFECEDKVRKLTPTYAYY